MRDKKSYRNKKTDEAVTKQFSLHSEMYEDTWISGRGLVQKQGPTLNIPKIESNEHLRVELKYHFEGYFKTYSSFLSFNLCLEIVQKERNILQTNKYQSRGSKRCLRRSQIHLALSRKTIQRLWAAVPSRLWIPFLFLS